MESGTSEWTAMLNRLERLEKQNSRFKQTGTWAVILAGSLLLMGQAPASRRVEANEFIVKGQAYLDRSLTTCSTAETADKAVPRLQVCCSRSARPG